MPRSYPKLTREQWREVANDVLAVDNAIDVVVNKHLTKFRKNSPSNKIIWKLYKQIGKLRSELDDELARQYKRDEMSFKEFVGYFYPDDYPANMVH